MTCSTTSVRSNFKSTYHVFGQQEAVFKARNLAYFSYIRNNLKDSKRGYTFNSSGFFFSSKKFSLHCTVL